MAKDIPIGKETLKNHLRPLLRKFWVTGRAKYGGFSDTQFGLPTSGQLKDLIRTYKSPSPDGELFDCEDFAFDFKAHVGRQVRLSKPRFDLPPTIGIAWGRFHWIGNGSVDHACNWVYDDNDNFRWFEPQDKSFHSLVECAGNLVLLLV